MGIDCDDMKESYLGKTNYKLSKIGLGAVQFGLDYGFTKKKTQEQVNEILECAAKNGINFIDTAREYGDSEKKIGECIAESNNDFIIATKLEKIPKSNTFDYNCLRDSIYRSIEASLNNLKLQNLDILQLHQTDEYLIANPNFWLIIEELKSEKIIGAFGASVYEESEALYIIENFPGLLDFIQVPYNVFDQRFSALEEILKKHSIGVVSRSTFLKGMIPCKINSMPEELSALIGHKMKLENIAEKLTITVEELALLFVYCNNFITSTILGVDTSGELESNVKTIRKYGAKVLNLKDLTESAINDLKLIDPRKWSSF